MKNTLPKIGFPSLIKILHKGMNCSDESCGEHREQSSEKENKRLLCFGEWDMKSKKKLWFHQIPHKFEQGSGWWLGKVAGVTSKRSG